MRVCCMRAPCYEKIVCWSLTNNNKLCGCSGISKGGGSRPGDGQRGFLSKMGMTVFKASHAVWEDGRYWCVCVHVASTCRIHIHPLMHTPNMLAYTHRIVSVMINDHKVWIAH